MIYDYKKFSLSVSDLLKLKKTKEIDHMESIKYLVEENNLQKKELEYLKQTIKNLEEYNMGIEVD